jgi:hypothetical protein
MHTHYLTDSREASTACDEYFETLLDLHAATERRKRFGEAFKSEWCRAMDRVLNATQTGRHAAGILLDDVDAFANLIAYHALMRELQCGMTLKEEAAAYKKGHRR